MALTKTLPRYRKHKSSGQAVDTLSGQDFYLGPYGTKVSRNEYDRLIGEWLANGRRVHKPGDEVTVKELVAVYLRRARTYYIKNGQPIVHVLSSHRVEPPPRSIQ